VPGFLVVRRGDYALNALVEPAPDAGVASLGKGRDQRLPGNLGWSGVVRLLLEARQHFDLLIVDGGGVAENVQVAPLLTAADEVLLIAQLARTTQGAVSRAADAAIIMGRPVSAVLLVDTMRQA
jgi:succinoglycan biosynthesis transport protein ExoP